MAADETPTLNVEPAFKLTDPALDDLAAKAPKRKSSSRFPAKHAHDAAVEHIAETIRSKELAEHVAVEAIPAHSTARVRFDAGRKALFLNAIAKGCSATAACRAAGISLPTCYYHREHYPAFARAWQLAEAVAADELEDKLDDKARAGEIAALIFSLKGRRPDKWRDGPAVQINQQINVTGRLESARARLKNQRE